MEERKEYHFYGWQNAVCEPINKAYAAIHTPIDLYEKLTKVWCAETCAPRLRKEYNNEHVTCGQCSITAFLVQDIFGGEVRGVLRPGGNYHCFNVVDGKNFDLTSEQFGDEVLDYTNCEVQQREVHFAKAEKYERYQLLTKKLNAYLEHL
ncbi:MAG: hypothetical protein Q4B22_01950 [Eubacteriales bacterium]|nr:hypothetical protein [Eubacteriales bacterium]